MWYQYTATCSGTVLVSAPAQPDSARYSIVQSCDIHDVVGTVLPGGSASLSLNTSQTVYIRAGTNSSLVRANLTFTVSCSEPILNDKQSGAKRITGENAAFTFDNTGALTDTCTNDVFFVWTATCTGLARASLCGPSVPTSSIALLTSTGYRDLPNCTSSSTTCTSSDPITSDSIALLQVTAGTDYFIAVGSSSYGSSSFSLSCLADPVVAPNDDCTSATAVSDGTTSYDSTHASNVQMMSDVPPYRDVWFVYTATCAGSAAILVDSTSFEAALVAVTSSCTGTTTTTASRGDVAAVAVTQGQQVYIRAGTSTPRQLGTGSLTISCVAPPTNDLQTNAVRITGTGNFPYNTLGTVVNMCQFDLFYLWTATCTGVARVSSCGHYNGTGRVPSVMILAASGPTQFSLLSLTLPSSHPPLGYVESGCVGTTSTCSATESISTSTTSSFLQVKQDVDYYIVAGTQGGWDSSSFDLVCDPQVQNAVNDECLVAVTIGDGHTSVDTTGATSDQTSATTPVRAVPLAQLNSGHRCHLSLLTWTQVYRDVWYRYVATCSGNLNVTLDSSPSWAQAVVALPGTTSACSTSIISTITPSTTSTISVTTGAVIYLRVGASSFRDSAVSSGVTLLCYLPLTNPAGTPGGPTTTPGGPVITTPGSTDGVDGSETPADEGFPVWAIAVIVVVALLLIAAIVGIVIFLRRRAGRSSLELDRFVSFIIHGLSHQIQLLNGSSPK